MMQFVLTGIVNRHGWYLKDLRGVFLKFCFLSSRRYHLVASCGLPIRSQQTFSISTRTVTRLTTAQTLNISHCRIHWDAITDTQTTDHKNTSTGLSTDDDCLDSESSNLHIPVLTKEIVNLIAPVKGQVRVFIYELHALLTYLFTFLFTYFDI